MTIIPFPVLLTYFQLHFRLAIILSLGMECFDYALDKVLVKYSVIKMLDGRLMTGYPFEHRNVGNASKVKKKTIFDVKLQVLGLTGADKDRCYPCWSMFSQA